MSLIHVDAPTRALLALPPLSQIHASVPPDVLLVIPPPAAHAHGGRFSPKGEFIGVEGSHASVLTYALPSSPRALSRLCIVGSRAKRGVPSELAVEVLDAPADGPASGALSAADSCALVLAAARGDAPSGVAWRVMARVPAHHLCCAGKGGAAGRTLDVSLDSASRVIAVRVSLRGFFTPAKARAGEDSDAPLQKRHALTSVSIYARAPPPVSGTGGVSPTLDELADAAGPEAARECASGDVDAAAPATLSLCSIVTSTASARAVAHLLGALSSAGTAALPRVVARAVEALADVLTKGRHVVAAEAWRLVRGGVRARSSGDSYSAHAAPSARPEKGAQPAGARLVALQDVELGRLRGDSSSNSRVLITLDDRINSSTKPDEPRDFFKMWPNAPVFFGAREDMPMSVGVIFPRAFRLGVTHISFDFHVFSGVQGYGSSPLTLVFSTPAAVGSSTPTKTSLRMKVGPFKIGERVRVKVTRDGVLSAFPVTRAENSSVWKGDLARFWMLRADRALLDARPRLIPSLLFQKSDCHENVCIAMVRSSMRTRDFADDVRPPRPRSLAPTHLGRPLVLSALADSLQSLIPSSWLSADAAALRRDLVRSESTSVLREEAGPPGSDSGSAVFGDDGGQWSVYARGRPSFLVRSRGSATIAVGRAVMMHVGLNDASLLALRSLPPLKPSTDVDLTMSADKLHIVDAYLPGNALKAELDPDVVPSEFLSAPARALNGASLMSATSVEKHLHPLRAFRNLAAEAAWAPVAARAPPATEGLLQTLLLTPMLHSTAAGGTSPPTLLWRGKTVRVCAAYETLDSARAAADALGAQRVFAPFDAYESLDRGLTFSVESESGGTLEDNASAAPAHGDSVYVISALFIDPCLVETPWCATETAQADSAGAPLEGETGAVPRPVECASEKKEDAPLSGELAIAHILRPLSRAALDAIIAMRQRSLLTVALPPCAPLFASGPPDMAMLGRLIIEASVGAARVGALTFATASLQWASLARCIADDELARVAIVQECLRVLRSADDVAERAAASQLLHCAAGSLLPNAQARASALCDAAADGLGGGGCVIATLLLLPQYRSGPTAAEEAARTDAIFPHQREGAVADDWELTEGALPPPSFSVPSIQPTLVGGRTTPQNAFIGLVELASRRRWEFATRAAALPRADEAGSGGSTGSPPLPVDAADVSAIFVAIPVADVCAAVDESALAGARAVFAFSPSDIVASATGPLHIQLLSAFPSLERVTAFFDAHAGEAARLRARATQVDAFGIPFDSAASLAARKWGEARAAAVAVALAAALRAERAAGAGGLSEDASDDESSYVSFPSDSDAEEADDDGAGSDSESETESESATGSSDASASGSSGDDDEESNDDDDDDDGGGENESETGSESEGDYDDEGDEGDDNEDEEDTDDEDRVYEANGGIYEPSNYMRNMRNFI